MKIRYDREEDILMIETGEGTIDHAEEMGPLITHFTRDGKPILLEIMEASDFLARLTKASLRSTSEQSVELSSAGPLPMP